MVTNLKSELQVKGFNLKYDLGRKKYIVRKDGDILTKLVVEKEYLMDKECDEIIQEYSEMANHFNELELFIESVKDKSISELTLKEFEKILNLEIDNTEVKTAYNLYWNNLSYDAKRKVRRLTDGMDSEYEGIAHYVYDMALTNYERIKSI